MHGDDWFRYGEKTDASLRAIIALAEGDSKFGDYAAYKEDAQDLDHFADLVEKIIREEINSDPNDWESKIKSFSQALFPIFEHGNRDNQFRAAKIAADVFSWQGRQFGISAADSAVFAMLKRLKAKGLDNLDLHRKEEFFFHEMMRAYDLDPNDVYDAWTKSVRNKRHKFSDIAYRNLTTIREIDFGTSLFESDVVSFLNKEYGLYDFSRYPSDLLIQQYMEKDRADMPYGLIITPRDDWNGAFYQDRDIYRNVFHRIQLIGRPDEHWIMRVVEVENKRELGRFALKFSKTYGQAEFGIVGGHGAPKDIGLGAGYKNMEIFNIDDLLGRGVQRGGAMLFQKGSTIILNSCETGVESGVAQQASETFGYKIIGPEQQTSIKQIIVENHDDKLQFRVEYNKGASHTYEQGKSIR